MSAQDPARQTVTTTSPEFSGMENHDITQQGKARGGKRRMRELGYQEVQVWFSAAEYDILRRAAEHAHKPVTFLVKMGAIHKAACVLCPPEMDQAVQQRSPESGTSKPA